MRFKSLLKLINRQFDNVDWVAVLEYGALAVLIIILLFIAIRKIQQKWRGY